MEKIKNQLIALLEENARYTNAQLAAIVGCTEDEVAAAVKALEDDAYKFYERAKAHEILVVPCDDFGVKGYVRIAYCTDKAKIIGSMPAFEALAKEYGVKN